MSVENLLFNFISCAANGDEENNMAKIYSELKKESSQDFGMAIGEWVDWFNSHCDQHESKVFIQRAFEIYKAREKFNQSTDTRN